MSIGGSKSSGSSSSTRTLTPTELKLIETQDKNLQVLTDIAQESFNLSQEDRTYYEDVFRYGTDTQAKEAIAKLQYQITGQEVPLDQIQGANVDQLLRDTILNSTPEFQEAATAYIEGANQLSSKYGADVTGLSSSFAKSINDLTTNYGQELQTIKEQTGTINQDVLSRETGAAMGGISQAYAEARKQMGGDLARRGLAGSGVEANLLANTYQQEALAKSQASTQARMSALQQSEAIRQTQAAYAGQQLQGAISGQELAYNANVGALQNVYGVASQANLQNYNLSNAATLQGIASLTQLAQAGQGIYAGSQNYISGATNAASNAASTAGSTAAALDMQRNTTSKSSTTSWNLSMTDMAKTAGAIATMGSASDIRLKTNIKYIGIDNGHSIYTWDWREGFDGGYTKGVIAQEVLTYYPEAISVDECGYYMVNYDMLGLKHLIKGAS